jgi:hypothetical protein
MCFRCFVDAWKNHCSTRHKTLLFSGRNGAQPNLRDVFAAEEYPLDLARKPSFDITADGTQIISTTATTGTSSSANNGYSITTPSPCPTTESADWQIVSTDKSYTPTEDDVGCVLRIEVRAVAVNGGQVLAGPLTILTDPILAAPRCAPKRQLITLSQGQSSSMSSTAGTRFRVISYNILAEIYATKQVCFLI